MNLIHSILRHGAIYILLCITTALSAQNIKLAQEYMKNGEYEKASFLFKALLEKNPSNFSYLENYVESLNLMGDSEEAIGYLTGRLKSDNKNPQLLIQLGRLYSAQQDDEQADKYYKQAINNLTANQSITQRVANKFYQIGQYQLALDAFKKAREFSGDNELQAYQIANLHNKLDQKEEMIAEYLISLRAQPNYNRRVQTVFTQSLDEEGLDLLEITLYEYIQDYPEIDLYPEMLQWLFITRKDYQNAFRQAKAIDTRNNEQGQRIFNIAQTASNAEAYDAAISGYRYIVENKGITSTLYIDAQRELLRNQRYKITRDTSSTAEDMAILESDYETFISGSKRKAEIASILLQYGRLQAYHLNNIDKGISILKDLVATPAVNKYILASAKLELADFYLIKGEIWEASLLNSQVDKEFGEDLLGHEARFRNAKLSYFNSDFEWAQTQFKVLKASTSKLIANDALERNVFITDNLGLDTTAVPLSLYAQAELNLIQNKHEAAQLKLDSIKLLFPEHGLLDDVAYLEARQAVKLKRYDTATSKYNYIIENHPDDIRADNAIYELAELYDYTLNDKEKALSLYEKIFIDYDDSVFITESRKRYRFLREQLGQNDLEIKSTTVNP